VLLAVACDFGWGSVGKLRLILDELPGVPVALHPDHGRPGPARELLGDRHQFVSCAPEQASVALVINDPVAADEITAMGVPVIYVDSLPYLWATPAEVPKQVAVYCAQRGPYGELAAYNPLTERPEIEWIDPIVPRGRGRRGGGGVVVNVGGLHSHLVESAADAYLRLVLLPLTELLADAGQPVAAVCGNLPRWACREVALRLPGPVAVGAQQPSDFEVTLRRADLLITSPGSTTILQAAASELPTILLPAQNLSQVLNTEIFSSAVRGAVRWPSSVLDRAQVERLRPAGEETVLRYVYSAISAAADSASARAAVRAAIAAGLAEGSTATATPAPIFSAVGMGGAGQVSRRVRQAMLAPLPRPRRLP
jgi:hydroxymethylcytosylglucuronate/cytosylglucuronate synthase